MNPVRVRPPRASDLPAWAALRAARWPNAEPEPPASGASGLLHAASSGVFLAGDGGVLVDVAEAAVRHDYVNATASSPVGFLDAWYVGPEWRGRGVGRTPPGAVQAWTRDLDCSGLASEALLDNAAGHAAHRACGFRESGRAVCPRKAVG